jgi:molybdopterin molybdotransferase
MTLLSVDAARMLLLEGVATLEAEYVPLRDAAGRILARDLEAFRAQPPFDVSAMDGYAARSADLGGPALRLVGISAAGHPFEGEMRKGEAVRIFTGALVPRGADTVVVQEMARADDGIVFLPAQPAGKHIRKAGKDFASGRVLLNRGTRLLPRHVGLAAAMDHGAVPVSRKPRLAILATGDELAEPGQGGREDRIVASNRYSVAALAEAEGARVVRSDLLPDRIDAIGDAVRAGCGEADVIVTLGGASVGDHDLIRPVLEQEGAEIAFHRIALRPGRPTLFARKNGTQILGLPGNPVSAYVCAILFLVPLLRQLQGHAEPMPRPVPAILGAALAANDERMDFLRARAEIGADGRMTVMPIDMSRQDSSMTAALAEANCLLIRAPHAAAAAAGERCEILPLG